MTETDKQPHVPRPKKSSAKRLAPNLGGRTASLAERRARAASILSVLASREPNPKTELEYSDPFTLLVAVALSAQATDKSVNLATRSLFAEADTPKAMLALGEEGIARHIRTIGLWRNKARNVEALSRLLVEKHNGEVPENREALEALPGVGRKTANVVLNEAFGQPTIAVDTHIFRVSNRTGIARGTTPDAVERGLEAVVPTEFKKGAHHWLILHGRYVCLARRPRCGLCAVAEHCAFLSKTSTDNRP